VSYSICHPDQTAFTISTNSVEAALVQGTMMTENRLDKMRGELRRGVLVLAVLASLKQPHYGYSLRKQLQDAGIDIDEGTLYPLVRRLAEQGLLDSEWQQAEGRERRYYQLSVLGSELLQQLSEEWQQLNGALGNLLEKQ
jgi:DNA-binding PadR family transcriptional regulator